MSWCSATCSSAARGHLSVALREIAKCPVGRVARSGRERRRERLDLIPCCARRACRGQQVVGDDPSRGHTLSIGANLHIDVSNNRTVRRLWLFNRIERVLALV